MNRALTESESRWKIRCHGLLERAVIIHVRDRHPRVRLAALHNRFDERTKCLAPLLERYLDDLVVDRALIGIDPDEVDRHLLLADDTRHAFVLAFG